MATRMKKHLRQLEYAHILAVNEVAVVEGLQAQVGELEVAFGFQCLHVGLGDAVEHILQRFIEDALPIHPFQALAGLLHHHPEPIDVERLGAAIV
jgi:hypothetical protein